MKKYSNYLGYQFIPNKHNDTRMIEYDTNTHSTKNKLFKKTQTQGQKNKDECKTKQDKKNQTTSKIQINFNLGKKHTYIDYPIQQSIFKKSKQNKITKLPR